MLSPEDPTITLFAKASTIAFTAELDAVQNRALPGPMKQDIVSADWIVWLDSPYTELIHSSDLQGLGFERVEMPSLANTKYQVLAVRRESPLLPDHAFHEEKSDQQAFDIRHDAQGEAQGPAKS